MYVINKSIVHIWKFSRFPGMYNFSYLLDILLYKTLLILSKYQNDNIFFTLDTLKNVVLYSGLLNAILLHQNLSLD